MHIKQNLQAYTYEYTSFKLIHNVLVIIYYVYCYKNYNNVIITINCDLKSINTLKLMKTIFNL
jgi:hypothetical protein